MSEAEVSTPGLNDNLIHENFRFVCLTFFCFPLCPIFVSAGSIHSAPNALIRKSHRELLILQSPSSNLHF
jgi:hypothetical protein